MSITAPIFDLHDWGSVSSIAEDLMNKMLLDSFGETSYNQLISATLTDTHVCFRAVKSHRLVARCPAALPAQVQSPPDWTLMTSFYSLWPSPNFQGPGSRQCCQTAEVKGQHVFTCSETDHFTSDWYITRRLIWQYKACCVQNRFISGAMKRCLEKW